MGDAAGLKQQGNELFKAGNFVKAVELYSKAERADPRDPVYPSNLSAALYETGDYAGCVDAVLRSWDLLKDKDDAKPDLIRRLSMRLARSLCHGVRAGTITQDVLTKHKEDIMLLQEAAAECPTSAATGGEHAHVWEDWETVKLEIDDYAQKADTCLDKLSRLPLFCKPLDHAKEFFSMGHDQVIDLVHGWGPQDAYPLYLDRLPADQLSEVAFLFGGVGDGRHVLGTLSGLYEAYKKLPEAKRANCRAHLTLLDIHDGTMARNLCLLMLLDQLNRATDPIDRAEINATLMYMFCGAVMPSYCYDRQAHYTLVRLMAVIDTLRTRLTEHPPGQLAWLHVVSDTIPAVVAILDFWAKTTKSTRKMLAAHECLNPSEDPSMFDVSSIPGANPDFQKVINQNISAEREMFKQVLLNMPEEQLLKLPLPGAPEQGSLSAKRAFVREFADELADDFMKSFGGGRIPMYEESWYRIMKVFLPPPALCNRHPGFDESFSKDRKLEPIPPALERKIMKHVEAEWKANISLFDFNYAHPRYYPDGDGFPNLKLNVFEIVSAMDTFNRRNERESKKSVGVGKDGKKLLAWQVCDAFFGEAAAALKGLESCITLELICGGLSEELAKIHFKGDLTRPKDFPRKYTRMWLSNVPDYTHGPMNMILYVVPNLQEHPQAAVASNCLLNTGAWTNDAEFVHTYTLLLPDEVPRYLGCPIRVCQPVMGVLVLGSQPLPRPLSELATRDELTTWLTRTLFNTFLSGFSGTRPTQIRLPHNLVAFFGLLMYLHRVGFPGHWLSDFLARVLNGRMVSDVVPYRKKYPIPVTDRHRRTKARQVRTDPWLVEFESIIATAYYAIPFPVAGALPADFSRASQDIVVWEVRVQPPADFWHHPCMQYSTPDEPRTHLLFYRPDLVSYRKAIDEIEKIFEGDPSPAPGTFFVLTAQEHVQYDESIRFRLSKRRVDRMRNEKWNMVAYRNDSGQQASRPVPIQNWAMVGARSQ
ncbi:hypothetical protein BD310DRAFT_887493 [Dichomitus squalens]|uniref:DUF4470 domain-containing protein n=1 Tax=Dichomitus squalens TaxID=114155 RepID=A0A4V2K6V0_9APHY|nr:hypothetical protein BD310DRAFT_887493 [Dichomitus squalens]